ncbi:yeats family-domain-containing protein [Blakeslea trispora]|nr:yeats family-domain-containing protein [Blakeslea trispora]
MKIQLRIFCNSKTISEKSNDGKVLHSWRVQIRSMNTSSDCLENLVDHVEYRLHPSFQEPCITRMHEPYRIERHGWGEFNMLIVLYFRDVAIPPKNIIFDLNFKRSKYSVQRTLDIPCQGKQPVFIQPSNLAHPRILPKPSVSNNINDNVWSMSVLYLNAYNQQQLCNYNLLDSFNVDNIKNDINLSHLSSILRSLNDQDLRRFYNLLSRWDLRHLGIVESQDEIILDLNKFEPSELLIVWKFVMNLKQYKETLLLLHLLHKGPCSN